MSLGNPFAVSKNSSACLGPTGLSPRDAWIVRQHLALVFDFRLGRA